MEGPVEIRRRESIKPTPRSRASSDPTANGSLPNGHLFYSPRNQNAEQEEFLLAVTCRVCQAEIILESEEGFVVNCNECGEATPIRNAPTGEKFVRCPCKCLLICKDSSQRVACPRPNCKRIITISETNASTVSFATHLATPGIILVSCVHCGEDFLFDLIHKSLASCPHCHKISSVGNQYRLRQIRIYLLVSLIFLIITGSVIFATAFLLERSSGIVALYIGLSTMTLLAFLRVIYFLRMKASVVQGEV